MRIELSVLNAHGDCQDVAIHADHGARWADIAAEIAACTGTVPAFSGWRPLSRGRRLGASGLHRGDLLSCTRTDPLAAPHRAGRRLHVVGGPSAGPIVALPPGRLVIGRGADCDLVLNDAAVSRRHAVIEADEREVRVRDLGSSHGTYVDDRLVDAAGTLIQEGRLIRVGRTQLTVSARRGEPASTRTSGDGTVLIGRAPLAAQGTDLGPVELPAPPPAQRPSPVQLAATLVPAAAGVVIALALRSPAFLLFAVLSPLTVLFGALGDRMHWRRTRRRDAAAFRTRAAAARAKVDTRLTAERERRRAEQPDAAAVLYAVRNRTLRVWERPRDGAGLLRARIGTADLPSRLRVRRGGEPGVIAAALPAVPAVVDLADGPLGLAGPRPVVIGIARHVITQLAALCSPADVRIALLLDRSTEAEWRWARWLPHLDPLPVTGALDGLAAFVRTAAPRTVLVVDTVEPPATVPGLVALLDAAAGSGLTAIVLSRRASELPAACASVACSADDHGILVELSSPPRDGQLAQTRLVADVVDTGYGEQLARALAPLADSRPHDAPLPTQCRLLDLLQLSEPTADGVLARWHADDGTASCVLGVDEAGSVTFDLACDGPHALVAGTTGSGKSELLRTMVAALAATHPPNAVSFILIDYKGGATFGGCADLPHTAGVVTDLDDSLTRRALRALRSELRRREQLFAATAVRDFAEYRIRGTVEPLSRLVIVVDEFAALAEQLPDFVRGLVAVAQRGRSLGVHLVLATQRPAGAVTADIRANAGLRIALRTTDDADSREIVDAPDAARLDPAVPGRAVLRHGRSLRRLQTATVNALAPAGSVTSVTVELLDEWLRPIDITAPTALQRPPDDSDLDRLVTAVRAAAERERLPDVHRPWLPPLPGSLPFADLPPASEGSQVAIGVRDDPEAQTQPPFTLDLGGSSLLVAGASGSGRTGALLTIAVCATARFGPGELHVYAIDTARGLEPLKALPHCGTVAHTDDFIVVATLLQRLTAHGADAATEAVPPRRLLLVDGWEAFQAAAEEFDGGGSTESLLTLLRTAPSAGLTVVITGDRGTLTGRVASSVQTRLALRLNDPADYALLGISPRDVPTVMPPGRAVRGGDGAPIQLARPDEGDRAPAQDDGIGGGGQPPPGDAARSVIAPIRVRSLPKTVRLADLPRSAGITLGVGGDAAEPITVDLTGGARRLLVTGPPRSGRSTVLRLIALQACATGAEVVVAAPECSPLAALARSHDCTVILPTSEPAGCGLPEGAVLVVDDGESFQGTAIGDLLARWERGRRPSAVVVAARSDTAAVAFRGLVAELRSARCGLLLSPTPADTALLDVALPRTDRHPRPGRGVLLGDRAWGLPSPLSIQVALAP